MSNPDTPAPPTTEADQSQHACAVCGQPKDDHDLTPAELVREPIAQLIRQDCTGWTRQSWICHADLHRYTARIVEQMLAEERGEISKLDKDVLTSLRENELVATNLNTELADQKTFGDVMADQIAAFGGSWKFVIAFIGIMIVWIAANTIALFHSPFDPYPFILLNLVLSCVAALQAPLIMMSQNRQEKRDRLRAEQDYKVNLKAELEVRLLMTQLDQLRNHQWQRLLEIQAIQTDLMQEILQQRDRLPDFAGTQPTP
ncbi:MAG: DUF1003 domain-containing protein [Prosthecobacter sp.]|nr:DUF1003 domain-containing protein [Prosthecobacter sp.]